MSRSRLQELNSEDAEYLIGNAISGISPQDIESITVLKDASPRRLRGKGSERCDRADHRKKDVPENRRFHIMVKWW